MLFLSSYSENMKLQNFIILKLSINSSDKGKGKDKNPLKLRYKGVTYVTIDKLLSKVMRGPVDILFRHKGIISILPYIKNQDSIQYFMQKVAIMQIATLLLIVLNVYN